MDRPFPPSVDEVRADAFRLLTERTARAARIRTQTASVCFSSDDPEFKRAQMSEAFARAHPEHKLSEPARPFYRMTLLDMKRDLETNIYTRAGAQTMGDFPLLLGDFLNKELRQFYTRRAALSGRRGFRQAATSG
jgi:hypothetical protein